MRHASVTFHLVAVAILISSQASTCSADQPPSIPFEVIRKHCLKCHGEDDGAAEADLNLAALTEKSLLKQPDLIRKLVDVLDKREMPPEDEPQPADADRRKLVTELQSLLRKATVDSGTRMSTPIRRMNRFQYNNAVVDLFQLNCIVFTLPERAMRVHRNYFRPETGKMPDVVTVGNRPLGKSQLIEPRLGGVAAFPQDLRAEHGYDNQADHLSLSPLLMESFLKLGQSITNSKDFTPQRVGIWESFFAEPREGKPQGAVRGRLGWFLRKAFRRPVEDAVLTRYTRFAQQQMQEGVNFTDAMKAVAAAAIASPRFLYLYDKSRDGEQVDVTEQTASDFELASRLSFFLWGSLPDEELLQRAASGNLSAPETLLAQVDRMLASRRLKRFCDSFPSQWLQLDRIVSSIPNRQHFPKFYFLKYRASMHMQLEPLLLFETVLIEDRPITDLIDPDFTYRSGKLDFVYGELGGKVKGKGGQVTVLNFRRVPIEDRRTGGVITNAAVMTMTSGPERTQPITRGAWIAGVIFNDPPEPPPADVPPLSEKPAASEEKLTLRERLAAHRKRADCRGCHEQIDPLGFALENFDPIGSWREKYENGRDVDSSGQLFRQHEFSNVVEFKDAIMAEKDRFARAFTGHLLSFALARELGPSDELSVDDITKAVIKDDYKIKTLIRQIVLSDPFLAR